MHFMLIPSKVHAVALSASGLSEWLIDGNNVVVSVEPAATPVDYEFRLSVVGSSGGVAYPDWASVPVGELSGWSKLGTPKASGGLYYELWYRLAP